MSTYYDFTILAKSKDENWQTLTLQFNKDLLFGWELPVPCTERAPSLDVATVFQTVTTKTRYKFIGVYGKDFLPGAYEKETKEIEGKLAHYGPIAKNGACILSKDVVDRLTGECGSLKDPAGVSVFIEEKVCRDHRRAWWVECNAWEEYLSKMQKEYEDRVGKLAEWNYIKQTLDFKKLTKHEKENIESEYGDVLNCFINDKGDLEHYEDENPIDYYRDLVYNIITMDGLIKRFLSDYDEVYCAIYNSSSDNYLVGKEAEVVEF